MDKLEKIMVAMDLISEAREKNENFYSPNEEDVVWLLGDIARSLRTLADEINNRSFK